MKPQSMIVLGLAVLFGLSAAMGIRSLLTNQTMPADQVNVVVPKVEIPRHSMISELQLEIRSFPKNFVPEGAVVTIEEVANRSALIPLVKGEPILTARLGLQGQHGLAAVIPNGMRGYTITTPNVAAGVAGLLSPGNKVDVILTVTNQTMTSSNGAQIDPTNGGSTLTILQNVEILAVDQAMDMPTVPVDPKSRGEMRSVTLLVSLEQAQKLMLGTTKGTMHLALRNPSDLNDARTKPTMMKDLNFWREKPNFNPLTDLLANIQKATAANESRKGAEHLRSAEAEKPRRDPIPSKMVINTIRGGSLTGRQEVRLQPQNQQSVQITRRGN